MLVLLSVCAIACSDALTRLTEPSVSTAQDSATVPPPITVEGCAVLDVRVQENASVLVTSESSVSCGPVQPVIVGSPFYDVSTSRLRIGLALHNSGRLRFTRPTSLSIAPDSSPAPAGPQAIAPFVSVTRAEPGDVIDPLGQHTQLSYQALLERRADTGQAFLLPGDTSAGRTLFVRIPPSASKRMVRLLIHTRATYVFTVPSRAPRSTSAAIIREARDSSHYAYLGHGIFARDKLTVRFQKSASEQDRQAAIDAIDGTVIGGTGGDYYIRIPALTTDRAGSAVNHALTVLKQQRGVASAGLDLINIPTKLYLRPTDGAGFTSWILSPSQVVQSPNWGPEAIAAPMAWGCSIGHKSTLIGVVDFVFDSLADLAPNVTHAQYTPVNITLAHGSYVASIIGAIGNNDTGMTGVMWHAGLDLEDISDSVAGDPSTSWARDAMLRTGVAGSLVVNVSNGINWHALGVVPSASNTTDVNLVNTFEGNLAWAIDTLNALGHHPLFILAAGDDGYSAWWTGYPAADSVDDYRSQIVVVGGTTSSSAQHTSLAPYSDTGSRYIDIAAPGDSVGVLDDDGSVVDNMSGTSWSAPFATGTAGLLLSFDSTMSIDSVKSYIIGGAQDGGRTAGGIPVLNAYDALKRVARQSGEPLCGNPVWSDSSSVYASDGMKILRGGGVVETISYTNSGFYGVPHFGKAMFVVNSSDGELHSLGWTPTGWIDNGVASNYNNPTGQWASYRNEPGGANHDGDTTLIFAGGLGALTIYYQGSLSPFATLPGGTYDYVSASAYGTGQVAVSVNHADSLGNVDSATVYMLQVANPDSTITKLYTYPTSVSTLSLSDDGSTLAVVYNPYIVIDLVDLTQPGYDVIYTGPVLGGASSTNIAADAFGRLRRAPSVGRSTLPQQRAP
jgi:hypothetical protein